MDAPRTPLERLELLRRAVTDGVGPVAIAVHDYPDPDALAGAFGMQHLLRRWELDVDIYHGGGLGRPENRVMTELVGIRLKLFRERSDWSGWRGVVVVDTQPAARNHSIPRELPILAVVDHHLLPPAPAEPAAEAAHFRHFETAALPSPGPRMKYEDVRADGGCSSALVYEYLQNEGIVPSRTLATALFLGVQTDTDDLLRDACPLDRVTYVSLLALVDMNVVRQVRRPLLSRSFYALMARALRRARKRGQALVSDCGDIPAPDQLSAISDLLIQSADAEWALALGRHKGSVYLSLRLRNAEGLGTRVLRKVVEPEGGSAGGHRRAAGGQATPPDGDLDRTAKALIRNFLELVDPAREPDQPLLPPEPLP